MSSKLYIEGAAQGDGSKDSQIRCREGFRKLLEKCGFAGRMPRLTACGGRQGVFDDFCTGHSNRQVADYVAMLLDSEDPLEDLEAAWQHLARCDHWHRPEGAKDEQVLFITTCMETWVIADRKALQGYYGERLQGSAFPSLVDLEARNRHDIQNALLHATRNCTNAYAKGDFKILVYISPDVLSQYLPSFQRARRILNDRL